MKEQTIGLLRHYAERFNTGENRPNCRVYVRRKDKKGDWEAAPFLIPNVMEISIDRRYNMAADELKVTFSNVNGVLSPDYSPKKDYQQANGLGLNGFAKVLTPFNEIRVDLGYGDELRRMFTGQIVNVTINEKPPIITLTCKNMFRKLLKAIDPVDKKCWLYENTPATVIVNDLLAYAGLTTNDKDVTIVDDKEYTIKRAEFNLGDMYSDCIKKILDNMNHRIYANRDGIICVKQIKRYSQEESAVMAFDDYVNMISGEYLIDSTYLRNRVIVIANDGWKAFEDPYLLGDTNGEKISFSVDAPWATDDEDGTPTKKWAVADSYFVDMRRKMRRISVGIKGHPALDVGDLVRVKALISTANSNYMVTGIKTTFNSMGYVDIVDLEFVTSGEHVCFPAEGKYDNVPGAVGGGESIVMRTTKRWVIIEKARSYLDTFYQYGGDRAHNQADYGMDASHFTWTVLEGFGLMKAFADTRAQYKMCEPITRDELRPGDLVFYSKSENPEDIVHVGFYTNNGKMISAAGGDSTIGTLGVARARNARVKEHLINTGNYLLYGRVPGM